MHQNRSQDTTELTSEQVHELALETLLDQFAWRHQGYRYQTEDIWNVLLVASAQGQPIDSTAAELEGAPCGHRVRELVHAGVVEPLGPEPLEQTLNQALVAQLPPGILHYRHKVAIDLVAIPYHGQPAEDGHEVCRSQAKSGTTHFHMYATAYLIKKNKRVTVALTRVSKQDTLIQVLQRLLGRLAELEIQIQRLLLDKGFCNVPVIDYFQRTHPQLEVIIPLIIRGKTGGTRALLKGRTSYRGTYTMRSQPHGQVTFAIAVAVKYQKGRFGKKGIQYFAYALLGGIRSSPHAICEEYTLRFGIESSYRLLHQCRARTSSRCPCLRLLLVGLGLMLINLWVYLKWTFLGVPRRGGRLVLAHLFPLSRFCLFLTTAIQQLYGLVQSVSVPPTQTRRAAA